MLSASFHLPKRTSDRGLFPSEGEGETRNIHVLYGLRCVERRQQHAQSPGVARLNARRASRLKEPLQPFVPERFVHTLMLTRCTQQG
jgi:hypothetical protein